MSEFVAQIEQQLVFILEMDKLKAVYRQALVKPDNNRQENSAEHSWHVALMAQVLQPYAAEAVDISRVIQMLLLHDVVEIDAGDTFAFAADVELDAQQDKEAAAAARIFGLLPQAQASKFSELWHEFEVAESADARFAKSMDRILPLVQNMANQGGSWARHQVQQSKVLARNLYLKQAAPKLWDFACAQVAVAVQQGWLLAD